MDISQTPYFAFRPWSHTDRRQMLMLTSPAAISMDALGVPATQALRLFEITEAFSEASHAVDAPIREALMTTGQRLPEHFPYMTVSWSPRAPTKLKVHSRSFMLRLDAYLWSDFMKDQNEEKGRLFFVAQLMKPEAATISP